MNHFANILVSHGVSQIHYLGFDQRIMLTTTNNYLNNQTFSHHDKK